MAKKYARKSAVEEKDRDEPVVEEAPWRMPQPERGQCIKIYPRGSMSERYAGIAFVVSCGEMSLNCCYMNNAYQDVIHIDDPRLKDNREDILADAGGVWDFAPETALERKVKELEERIKLLEG